MTRKQKLLLYRVAHHLPLGYTLQDTGAPRGERNCWVLKRNGAVVKESMRLSVIADYVDEINRPEKGEFPSE